MKKTVFSILIGLILFGLTGCKTDSDNSVTYKTVCITEINGPQKIQLIYDKSEDNYQIGFYLSPSYQWYTSSERDVSKKANTFQLIGNAYMIKQENQPVYSKTDGNKTFYSYKEDGEYTKVENFTCTLFSAYVFDLKDPTDKYLGEELSIMIFTKDGKTYYSFGDLSGEAVECSCNNNGTIRINNGKGKLFYDIHELKPLVEREYNGTTKDNGKLFYVVMDYVE